MKNRSLLTKLIMFGCLISILPVLIVGIFSYLQSTSAIQTKVNEEKIHSIKQINSNVEQVLKTVDFAMNSFIDSNIVVDALGVSMVGDDFKLHRDLRKESIMIQSMETRIEDIIIVNKENNWLLNNVGITRLDEHPDQEKYLSFFDLPQNSSWLLIEKSEFTGSYFKRDCEASISLIKKLPTKRSTKKGLAIANIPVCDLASIINIELDSEEFMIVDNDYRIMVHHQQDMIGQSLLATGHIDSEDHFSNEKGQFDTEIDDKRYTVTYTNSNFNNWKYMSFNSIDLLTEDAKKIGWFTMSITLIMIMISLLCVWIITKKLYSPVNRVVTLIHDQIPLENVEKENEFVIIEEQIKHLFSSKTDMELELKEHSQQGLAIFLNRLFLGNFKTSEVSEKIATYDLEGIVENWKTHTVLTLQIDPLDNTVYELKDMELLAFAISNIVEESLPSCRRLPVIWIDNTLAILLGFKEQEIVSDSIYEITESIQKCIEENLKISVSIGISMPFDPLKNAAIGYREGVEALKHRIKLGKGVIIHYSSVNTGKSSIIYEYPRRTEEELIVSIKLAEKEKAINHLEIWMEKLFNSSQSPREYQISLMRLLNNLLMVKQENNISFKQIQVHHESLYEELMTFQMKEEIIEWFKKRLVLPLVKVFSERRDSQFHNLSEKIIDLIHKYYDKDITLEECAAKLHYNANYLSSVFKQETNHTFSEYLANYRFKLAKQWLTETDMTVKEIADKLQYNNSQNFIRSFKKQENMTPGQYRQQNKGNS